AGGGRGRRRPRAARALRRADAADEDARRRSLAAAARTARLDPALGRHHAVSVAPHPALVPQRDEIEVGTHPWVALHLLPLPEVLLVRSGLDRLAGRDRVELEELENPTQHACRVADELLVREDVHPVEVLSIRLEQCMTAEPVLEQPVVAAGAAAARGG